MPALMKDRLALLYHARKQALEAEAAVLDVAEDAELVPRLSVALDDARAQDDRTERSFRLQVLADVLSRVDDAGATALLLGILSDPDSSVRARAAMGLARGGAERLPVLAKVVLDALDDGLEGPALLELPGLLLDCADIDTPPPLDVFVRLLDHEDADVAAEAACALAEVDVDGVRELLESFLDDERSLSDVAAGPNTLGALIGQLLDTLALDDDVP
jgi:HEAT repeat protein